MQYSNRHRLKKKNLLKYHDEIRSKLGNVPFKSDDPVDIAATPSGKVLLTGDTPLASFFDGEIFPTIKGLLKMKADKCYVVVDMGAVSFLYNGADVMAPGVVDADEDIVEGQLVWVRDQNHGKPLTVGRALTSGKEMIESDEGKVIKSLHHVGDGKYS